MPEIRVQMPCGGVPAGYSLPAEEDAVHAGAGGGGGCVVHPRWTLCLWAAETGLPKLHVPSGTITFLGL